MAGSELIDLNCFLLGDESYDPFPVLGVPPRMRIATLIAEVTRAYDGLARGNKLVRIKLYKINISTNPEELASIIAAPSEPLKAFTRVDSHWPDPAQVSEDHVQVLITADVIPIPSQVLRSAHGRVDPISAITLSIHELTIRQEQTAQAFRNASSALAAATHQEFERQQTRDHNPIFNGRPQNRTELPIQLFHPAFDFFAGKLTKSDDLTARDYIAVEKLLFYSVDFYNVEKTRWKGLKDLLSAVIGHPIQVDPIAKCESDGVVIFMEKYSTRKAYGIIVEIKNEIGAGDSDPWVQGAQSYSRYWSQAEMAELRLATCCPSLIISIAGPWMCISGALYLDRVIVQPLTDYVWLGNHPQQDYRLTQMTQTFNAISTTVSYLQGYYRPFLTSTTILSDDLARFFPHIRSFQTPSASLSFRYVKRLGSPSVLRPVFEATTEDGRALVVKFAQSYNHRAHQLLSSHSLAPKLLYYSPERISGGLWMIVMELSGTSLDVYNKSHPRRDSSRLAQVRADIEKALKILHEQNLVFGDLRPPNVLITSSTDGTLGGQLIDFDWCGIEGRARYPVGMNQDHRIGWAPGVEKGSLLSKRHDNYMFEKLFS